MASWTFDEETRTGRLAVEQGVTIATVQPVRKALLQGFATADRIVFDLGGAATIDVAGLQLIYAAHRFAAGRAKALQLMNIGERFRELACAAGFVHGEVERIDEGTPCGWVKMA